MNRNVQKSPLLVPLLVCLVITVVMGGVLMWLYGDHGGELPPDTADTTDRSDETKPPEAMSVIFKTDLSAYEKYMDPEQRDEYLLLVNKQNLLPESYKPSELVSVKDARKDISLVRTAEMALEAMFIEMRAEGFGNIFVTSAYRSYSYQTSLFNTYINEEMAKDPSLNYTEAKEKVLRYSAYPGTSEHQTGLCVDLMSDSMRELDESFADEPVYEWLLENAWKFGFVLRFPEDKTDLTGYDFEPWHYRFVGRYHAYMMWRDGLCLEEYLALSTDP